MNIDRFITGVVCLSLEEAVEELKWLCRVCRVLCLRAMASTDEIIRELQRQLHEERGAREQERLELQHQLKERDQELRQLRGQKRRAVCSPRSVFKFLMQDAMQLPEFDQTPWIREVFESEECNPHHMTIAPPQSGKTTSLLLYFLMANMHNRWPVFVVATEFLMLQMQRRLKTFFIEFMARNFPENNTRLPATEVLTITDLRRMSKKSAAFKEVDQLRAVVLLYNESNLMTCFSFFEKNNVDLKTVALAFDEAETQYSPCGYSIKEQKQKRVKTWEDFRKKCGSCYHTTATPFSFFIRDEVPVDLTTNYLQPPRTYHSTNKEIVLR